MSDLRRVAVTLLNSWSIPPVSNTPQVREQLVRSGARQLVLVGAPFNSAGTNSGVAQAPRVLRECGLAQLVEAAGVLVADAGDVPVGLPKAVRDSATGLLAYQSLQAATTNLGLAVSTAIEAGGVPVVIGGDCAVLIGALRGALAVAPQTGLIFIDGHEDAWPTSQSPSGEAADCELGLLLGLNRSDDEVGLASDMSALAASNVVVLGPRDADEIEAGGIPSVRGHVGRFLTGDELTRDLRAGKAAATEFVRRGLPWWLHVDLDVLSTAALPAVDYQQAGGLSWNQLAEVIAGSLSVSGCIGASVCIYNPDLDPTRSFAASVNQLIVGLAEGLNVPS